MLEVVDIKKSYKVGKIEQKALDGVSLTLRENEFVAILGHSGSGKTTLLNIIGGLDTYDSGDLIINGRSTKGYNDRDWDTYRNHTIGFVFQSYNLIPHQSVLSNVELALTLKGLNRKERREKARQALIRVGLEDHIHKKPNQLSGGQMQRVAIARALVNDPDVLLADEPTGALDSETSVQIMDLLKEIAANKLVVMVTHNPDLAEEYANRIIRIADGKIISDTNPCNEHDAAAAKKREKRPGMSFWTALTLSFNNLRTKKGRTFLTSGAGSIGIIGIALITSISTGVNAYIEGIERDTLASYPIVIEKQSVDLSSIIGNLATVASDERPEHDKDAVYSLNIMTDLIDSMTTQITSNNLKEFKAYLEEHKNEIDQYINGIQYTFSAPLLIYSADTSDGIIQVNPSSVLNSLRGRQSSMFSSSALFSSDVWQEMIENPDLYEAQYDIIAGSWADNYDEVVLFVTEDNEVTDYMLYSIGLMDQDEIEEIFRKAMAGEPAEAPEQKVFTYDDILNTTFKLVLNPDIYQYNYYTKKWEDQSDNAAYMVSKINDGLTIKIAGIARPKKDTLTSTSGGSIGYQASLTRYVSEKVFESNIVKAQLADPDTDVFTGLPFEADESMTITIDMIRAYMMTRPAEEQAQFEAMVQTMSEEAIIKMFSDMLPARESTSTYEKNISKLGVIDLDDPASISIYPKDIDAKDQLTAFINDYNKYQTDRGNEEYTIQYTDITALLLKSVTTIINVISYVLIAFVAISLIVSSIMIGVITNISVLERIKEIGILRAMGASKRDVSRVFNAETLIIGLLAGLLGVGITYVLIVPINIAIGILTNTGASAMLDWRVAVALVVISVLLTLISGLIPASSAAKKDPVIALRTE